MFKFWGNLEFLQKSFITSTTGRAGEVLSPGATPFAVTPDCEPLGSLFCLNTSLISGKGGGTTVAFVQICAQLDPCV